MVKRLESLAPQQQQVLRLRYMGRSFEQIAQEIGLPASSEVENLEKDAWKAIDPMGKLVGNGQRVLLYFWTKEGADIPEVVKKTNHEFLKAPQVGRKTLAILNEFLAFHSPSRTKKHAKEALSRLKEVKGQLYEVGLLLIGLSVEQKHRHKGVKRELKQIIQATDYLAKLLE